MKAQPLLRRCTWSSNTAAKGMHLEGNAQGQDGMGALANIHNCLSPVLSRVEKVSAITVQVMYDLYEAAASDTHIDTAVHKSVCCSCMTVHSHKQPSSAEEIPKQDKSLISPTVSQNPLVFCSKDLPTLYKYACVHVQALFYLSGDMLPGAPGSMTLPSRSRGLCLWWWRWVLCLDLCSSPCRLSVPSRGPDPGAPSPGPPSSGL